MGECAGDAGERVKVTDGYVKKHGYVLVDWTAEGLNAVALAAGWLLSKLKGSVFEKKSIIGTVFGVLSMLAGFDQHNKWVGVAGVLMGFVSLIFGVWSVIDTVETTLDVVLFTINLLAGMNGLGFSAIGLVV